MLLCIDTGNTNTVFSIWDGANILCTLRTATEHQPSSMRVTLGRTSGRSERSAR